VTLHFPTKPRPEVETTLSGIPRVVGERPSAGTPEEGPAEHIRNALSILVNVEVPCSGEGPHGEVQVCRGDLEAIERRLRTALAQLQPSANL